jgi:hypothetical protein
MSLLGGIDSGGYDGWGRGEQWWWIVLISFIFFGYWGSGRDYNRGIGYGSGGGYGARWGH